MAAALMDSINAAQRRRRVRLTTLVLTVIALAIYVGFIAMAVRASHA